MSRQRNASESVKVSESAKASILRTFSGIAVLAGSLLLIAPPAVADSSLEQNVAEEEVTATEEPPVTIADASETFALDDEGRLVSFERDIAPLLRSKCMECHGVEDAKGDFRVDDSETLLSYIEPEDPESSTLFADYLVIDDDDLLMPPRSHGGPLSAAELSLIRVWISEGAAWPEGFQLDSGNPDQALAVPVKRPTSLAGRAWAAQGFLHPATIHFPVALLTLGAAFVVLGWKWPSVGTQIPLACLLIGAVTAIASTAMGWSFAVERGYGSWNRFDAAMMDKEVFWHRWTGVLVTVLATVFAIIALMAQRKDSQRLTFLWKAGLLICAAMVGAVGHQGGEMSYGKDFYPKAWRTLTGATLETTPDSPATVEP